MTQESDHPHDLNERREEFLRSFVRRGVELTEELIRENRELQNKLFAAEQDNTRLRAQLASDDAIRELLQKIELLERERSKLLTRSHELEGEKRANEGRVHEIEHDLTELASLYVAGDQLAANLEPRRVVRNIRELLEQFVGVRSFVMYRVEPSGARAAPIATHGQAADGSTALELAEGEIADACLTGMMRIVEPAERRDEKQPLAIVPLVVGDQTLAVIVVLELLPHKARWEPVDRELFKLLSRRAPVSLLAAAHSSGTVTPRAALSVFADALVSSAGLEGKG